MQAWRSKSLFAAIFAAGYVVSAALSESRATGPAWLALILLPIALAAAWIATAPPKRVDPIHPSVRLAARWAASGAALVIAGWSGPAGRPELVLAANIGAAITCIAALVALARINSSESLLEAPHATRRLDAVALASLIWGIGVGVPAARTLFPESTTLLDPIAIDYTTLAASSGSLGLILAASARVRALRRLELGVADRATGAFALCVVVLAIAVPSSFLRVAPPDRVMIAASVIAAATAIYSCISRDPADLARTMRTILAITLLGAPVALLGVGLALRSPRNTGLVTILVATISIVVGLVAKLLAVPLGPARSRWLDAINKANDAALNPDPDMALQDSLATVRNLLPGESASPALFRASPPEVLTIDRAGYLHKHVAEAPEILYKVAEAEPERTLRTEVLRALEVRRPELRPLLAWLDARGVLAATVIRDEDGPVGLIALPRGTRRAPMNLEEVRALRVLADRVGAVLGVSSALARSRAREMDLRTLADRRGDEIDRLQHRIQNEGRRYRGTVERFAQPVQLAAYSPAATMAVEQVKRAGHLGIPITLLTPPGIDAVAWAAVGHLAGARQDRRFVIVRGTDTAEHSLDRWRDADLSPLCLAAGGSLVITDLCGLPKTVQDFIAASLSERISPAGPTSPLDIAMAVSIPLPMVELVESGRLSSTLAAWLGDRSITVPPLAQRTEDLRALCLDRLAQIGSQLGGTPIGIDDTALAMVLAHSWPGNDVELDDVLLRAALLTKTARITSKELELTGRF